MSAHGLLDDLLDQHRSTVALGSPENPVPPQRVCLSFGEPNGTVGRPDTPTEQRGQHMATTRAEHLTWCKQRALEYVNHGDLSGAVASMMSDLGKHPDTVLDPALGMLGLMAASSGDTNEVRRFVEGFN